MSLEEFKFIYFWEYGHRMMGRMIGVAYTVPAVYFIWKGAIERTMYPRIGENKYMHSYVGKATSFLFIHSFYAF